MMTIAKALKRARSRVSIVPNGRRQYVLHTWSPHHNATWVSHSMTWAGARAAARENMIFEALAALEVEDANAEAYVLAEKYGRWDELVREFIAKQKAARASEVSA